MSAPQQGRQSPDPERQTGKQQQAPPATDPNKQGQEPSGGAADTSKDALKNLESNPEHVLKEEAEKKTAK
ncbi:uncharacterized protein LTR77_005523 [Saxophila tyrrhenica]|uniref:Uncharacterized protein n=1 Tax=Saxophila tyrrhenica TaxID=1690608 RepID=A0AAV9PCR8_9PEZI|nr:hypothetical protein LTR77_005523 [Saxophila tyrrhenica]